MPTIFVGYSKAWLDALARYLAPDSVVLVDEPDVIRKRGVRHAAGGSAVVQDVVDWEYQLDGAADAFYQRYRTMNPTAVIPVVEYAVPFAARLAERYAVPGAGYGAAMSLRDKRLLRLVTGAAGVANPHSVPVEGPDGVRAFMTEHAGPVVLKPANRQASVGTRILYDPGEVDDAWQECLEQDEGVFVPDRPMAVRMLVEQFVRGTEFSVEMLVRAGSPVFAAVTRKFLFDGPRPVEQGHVHPADVSPELAVELIAATSQVVDAVAMHTGFVHCEWIVSGDVPHLVECAGRLAGGGVMDLIEMAWGYDVFGQYLALMSGGSLTEPPVRPSGYAAAWGARLPAGEVVSCDGVDEARAVPGVRMCLVAVDPGDRVSALRSSWDRAALVTASGATAAEALDRAQQAIAKLIIKVL
jgi:biotin carboxylase